MILSGSSLICRFGAKQGASKKRRHMCSEEAKLLCSFFIPTTILRSDKRAKTATPIAPLPLLL